MSCESAPPLPEPPSSSAELCLYLIMILPDIDTRRLHIKDFCRLYDIREKREESRLSVMTKQRSEPQTLRGEP